MITLITIPRKGFDCVKNSRVMANSMYANYHTSVFVSLCVTVSVNIPDW